MKNMDNTRVQHKMNHSKAKKVDDASRFKRESLRTIKRRNYFTKYAFMTLVIIALFGFCAVLFAYIIDK